MKALTFLIFYTILVLFVVEITVLSGQEILTNTEGFTELAGEPNILNPFYVITALWTLSNLDSSIFLMNTIVILPFIAGLVYIIASFIRGTSI